MSLLLNNKEEIVWRCRNIMILHSSAFGAAILDSKFDEFINYFNKLYKDFNCSPIYKVDFIYQGDNISWSDIAEIAKQESLWGKGIEQPLIAIEGFKVFETELKMCGIEKGKPTLKIQLNDGRSLIKFKATQEEFEELKSGLGYTVINIIGTCQWNNWSNLPQIYITDYEIVDKQQYYF